jgi:hypothetical protein
LTSPLTINQQFSVGITSLNVFKNETSDTLSLILREENGLRVSEKRVLWKISGPMRENVTEGWRKLRTEQPITFTPYIRQLNRGLDGWDM